ncbi:GNAT family N-acetyltransferase [Caulobacter sp. 1776]|uniref:GNAT family N-acetyltransferase n=1 Tax=Caulobacter sp. 1776 TaxID=3156420 RepID=UPI00339A7BF5
MLVALMRELAVFEDYADAFAVTEASVIEAGFGPEPRFGALVAEADNGALVGMAVHYIIPWTYDLRPTLVLKELFVSPQARGQGVGAALMAALVAEGRRIGAGRINWTVMVGNARAEDFYRGLGGAPDAKWRPWTLPLESEST